MTTRYYENMTKYVALQGGDSEQTAIGATNPLPVTLGYTTKTAVIAESGSLSGEVDLEGYSISHIVMPAAWTAANITFAVSTTTGGTFVPLYDESGSEVTSVVAASGAYAQDANAGKLFGIRYIKLRSGTNASAVTQTAARTLTLLLKG